MQQPPELSTIERVIPVMETRDLSRGQLTCVSLEVYNDGWWLNFWIDFRVDISLLSPPPSIPPLETAAVDDRGNQYTGWMAGAVGGGSRLRVGHRLGPALAPDANSLQLWTRIGESETGSWSRNQPAVWTPPVEHQEGSETEPNDHMLITIPLQTA